MENSHKVTVVFTMSKTYDVQAINKDVAVQHVEKTVESLAGQITEATGYQVAKYVIQN